MPKTKWKKLPPDTSREEDSIHIQILLDIARHAVTVARKADKEYVEATDAFSRKWLSETACAFCQEVIPDVEPCPLCGKRACVDHGSIIHFKRNGTHEEYLWACEDCEEVLSKEDSHYASCKDCEQNPEDGCPVFQQQQVEYNRILTPIIEAWEKGQSVLGMLRPECPVHCGTFRASFERVPDSTQKPQAGEVL